MLFAGSTITSGRGKGLVVATGLITQVGQIADTVTTHEGSKPPLVQRMERFITQITYAILGIAAVLAIILTYQGVPYVTIFFLIVALAVSAIPEGLPVSLTIALTLATIKMSKRNVIVRNLNAVESLGSCTIIASDKTGTLTVNQQTLKLISLPYNKSYPVSTPSSKCLSLNRSNGNL